MDQKYKILEEPIKNGEYINLLHCRMQTFLLLQQSVKLYLLN